MSVGWVSWLSDHPIFLRYTGGGLAPRKTLSGNLIYLYIVLYMARCFELRDHHTYARLQNYILPPSHTEFIADQSVHQDLEARSILSLSLRVPGRRAP